MTKSQRIYFNERFSVPSEEFERKIGMPVGTISTAWKLPEGVSYKQLDKICKLSRFERTNIDFPLLCEELKRLNRKLKSLPCNNIHMFHGVASKLSVEDIKYFIKVGGGIGAKDYLELQDIICRMYRIGFSHKGKYRCFEWVLSPTTVRKIKKFIGL